MKCFALIYALAVSNNSLAITSKQNISETLNMSIRNKRFVKFIDELNDILNTYSYSFESDISKLNKQDVFTFVMDKKYFDTEGKEYGTIKIKDIYNIIKYMCHDNCSQGVTIEKVIFFYIYYKMRKLNRSKQSDIQITPEIMYFYFSREEKELNMNVKSLKIAMNILTDLNILSSKKMNPFSFGVKNSSPQHGYTLLTDYKEKNEFNSYGSEDELNYGIKYVEKQIKKKNKKARFNLTVKNTKEKPGGNKSNK